MEGEIIMKWQAKIEYTMDKDHPDVNHVVGGWYRGKKFTYYDEYKFESGYTEDYMKEYMKKDLKLVAGGGYNTSHIHNVKFQFIKVA
jgi:hypothetical protein